MTGLILLDKPAGQSSFSALGNVKRVLGTRKVGHAGTLDPFATGLLVALSGRLTRLVPLMTALDKEYVAVVRTGEETDTLDPEGEVVARADVPGIEALARAAGAFRGEIEQVPPAYSAVKIDGRRAYARARSGEAPLMPSRRVTVHSLDILDWKAPDLTVRVRCSKGTYVRSLARDIAAAAGSRGYCVSLRRTAVGPFRVDEAVTPADFGPDRLLGPAAALERLGVPVRTVGSDLAAALRTGKPCGAVLGPPEAGEGEVLWTDGTGAAAALTAATDGRRRYAIVFE